MPDSVTQIQKAGPVGTKLNIAILGDGFAAADQTLYNDTVQSLLMDGVFGHDYFYEDKQAFNVFRVNLISNDSGVSTRQYDEHGTPDDASDDTIISTTLRDTALKYIFSGSWAHCWLEGTATTGTLVNAALTTWVPDYDLVVVILNNPNYGGCGGGGFQIIPRGVTWPVLAHEFGHGTGGLADEYCTSRVYSGPEPGVANLTTNTNRNTLKWKKFVAPATPVPTGTGNCAGYTGGVKPPGWSDAHDAGLFEGGGTNSTGMYRPVINCRMRGNTPEFCPVCYTEMKNRMHTYTGRNFLKCYAGDFNGDGKSDLLVHNGNSIMIYRSNGTQLDVVFSTVERVPGSWQFQPNDRFYIGDFNGDGKDEVAVFNGTDWVMEYLGLLADDGNNGLRLIARYDNSMPGWDFKKDDQFFVADFNGDGKKDLIVFNGTSWVFPYLGMLRSSGTGFSLVKRYDQNLPGWQMTKGDKFYVGDFNGDGKEDLFVFNGDNWAFPYLGMLQSTGTAYRMVKRYDQNLPGWQMTKGDKFYVADFNGDGKKDIYLFNGENWVMAYLGMLSSSGTALSMVRRYDGNAPGWQMRRNDQHYVCNIKGDSREDLFVFNCLDWSTEYLGTMASNGTTLSCAWKEDWVGEWNLGRVDRFIPCNFEGAAGKRDLFVHNTNWFGMIKATPTLSLQKLYFKWIHNYRHGRNW
ncbi:M64 family metallopeptidase [Paraflavitalea sp. CAU 1676]|uniref:M64 family metallopeptidase n=1 Tax=Paraflavitalea sp. CAU 1676 TaxID=3032598 RepID=UPI0023DBE73F|nr:M64 family metallopeptidase [Paraflavitalea sp. CAU 1676]MDF2189034.1 M64 family metallopeptidase [Paraflavitalea sp. CAU 1676]